MQILRYRTGQTLIEALIASVIIVIGVTSMLALLSSVTRAGNVSRDEVIAIQLAREGIEGIYAIRNSNWIRSKSDSSVQFSDGLRDGTDYTGILALRVTEVDPDNVLQFIFNDDLGEDPDYRVYTDETGYYVQGEDPGTWAATPYSRQIILRPICLILETATEVVIDEGVACEDTGDEEIGIEVAARVYWNSASGETSDRTIYTRLYDWRYADNIDVAESVFGI